ncbi:MAG: PEP-CTERM sorting domain-containing protein, partial [Bryobacteraceae bacterium]
SAVTLNGNPAQNDLYAGLSINFAGLELGGLIPQDLTFTQPTDRNVAPEPVSLALILAGLSALLLLQVRRFWPN